MLIAQKNTNLLLAQISRNQAKNNFSGLRSFKVKPRKEEVPRVIKKTSNSFFNNLRNGAKRW